MHNGTIFTIHTYIYTINSIQLLSVYFLNIRVSQLTKRIQDLQKDGDTARLRMSGTYNVVAIIKWFSVVTSPLGLGKFLSIGSERLTDVVDAYEHALLGLFPRARYMVGRDAVFIYLPIQWLPEWLGDWIFAKLDPDLPLPAALTKKASQT